MPDAAPRRKRQIRASHRSLYMFPQPKAWPGIRPLISRVG
jgi:hypothetical protein